MWVRAVYQFRQDHLPHSVGQELVLRVANDGFHRDRLGTKRFFLFPLAVIIRTRRIGRGCERLGPKAGVVVVLQNLPLALSQLCRNLHTTYVGMVPACWSDTLTDAYLAVIRNSAVGSPGWSTLWVGSDQ